VPGRYLRHDYAVGQEISFGEIRGRITTIEPPAPSSTRVKAKPFASPTTSSWKTSSRSTGPVKPATHEADWRLVLRGIDVH